MTENNVKWELSGSDNELGLARPLNQRLNKMTLLFILKQANILVNVFIG